MKFLSISILKILVTITCLYFLHKKLTGIDFQYQFLETFSLMTLTATIIFLSHLFFVAIRWRFFVLKLDGELSYVKATQYVAISSFLNNTPLGLIVGDAYRSLAIQAEKFRLRSAVGSVLLDRYTALLGWCITPIITVIFFSIFNLANSKIVDVTLFLTAFTVSLLVFPFLQNIRPLRCYLVSERLKFFFDYLVQLSLIFYKAHFSIHSVFKIYFTTFYVVITSGIITFIFAAAAGANLGLLNCIIVTSFALVAGAIPLSVGGFGVRELSFVGLFEFIDVPLDTAFLITASFSLSFFLASLVGALVWLSLGASSLINKR